MLTDQNERIELNDNDREEIGRLIKEGYTSGILDEVMSNGKTKFISWELKKDIWTD